MDSLTTKPDPIDLQYWPTARRALSWSSEDLAVATGETVHILTHRELTGTPSTPSDQQQWHKFTIRVNQFEETEWPSLSIAPLEHFSIGEELSDSTVVSLAWSPPGLGTFKRSVLAILTSNLLLTFWETNGRPGVWKRTCIVNGQLRGDRSPKGPHVSRRPDRIRAFHWLPRLSFLGEAKWGSQLLAVADDNFVITVFRVCKLQTDSFGQWSFEPLADYEISNSGPLMAGMAKKLTLRAALSKFSPVASLESSEWRVESEFDSQQALSLKVSFGQCRPEEDLHLQASKTAVAAAGGQSDLNVLLTKPQEAVEADYFGSPSESIFDSELRKLRSDYSTKFGLGGRVRVRFWGGVFSPGRTLAAACVSFHPSDIIEYGAPSSQRTWIVFTRIKPAIEAEAIWQDVSTVHEQILASLTKCPVDLATNDLDKNIFRTAIALIEQKFSTSRSLMHWTISARQHLNDATPLGQASNSETLGVGKTEPQHDPMHIDERPIYASGQTSSSAIIREVCEICDNPIPFSASSSSAKCVRGHQFSRCSLSFVAIQEPGISKHCARCGRQFLDLSKLTLPDGPSLSQALFEEFDVCPYCQGKFRG